MNNLSIASVTDRLIIIELINQFGMAIDLRDWSSFRSLFADSVVVILFDAIARSP